MFHNYFIKYLYTVYFKLQVKWIANLSINFSRVYDDDQSNRQDDEEIDPSETIEKGQYIVMDFLM